MNRELFFWILLFIAPNSLVAEWRVVERQPAEVADGIPFRLRVGDGFDTAELLLILFHPAKFDVRVVSNSGGQYVSAGDAASALDAVAGINGGYFREDGTPVGLLIADGRKVHQFESAKLLSGVFFVRDEKPAIVRSQSFSKLKAVTQAVQAGPFLVENGRGVTGLNNDRSAARTFVFMGTDSVCGFGICRLVTLAGMSRVLLIPDLLGGSHMVTALNLDGGASTQFWARSGEGVVDSPAFSIVANYLLLVKRGK